MNHHKLTIRGSNPTTDQREDEMARYSFPNDLSTGLLLDQAGASMTRELIYLGQEYYRNTSSKKNY